MHVRLYYFKLFQINSCPTEDRMLSFSWAYSSLEQLAERYTCSRSNENWTHNVSITSLIGYGTLQLQVY